jgi:bacterioferritin-associated ferredoxin
LLSQPNSLPTVSVEGAQSHNRLLPTAQEGWDGRENDSCIRANGLDREVVIVYLCICKSVSDRQIREAVELGARTIGDLNIRLGVSAECGKCTDSVREFLDACLAASSPTSATEAVSPIVTETVKPSRKPAESAPERAWFAVDL